MEQLRMYYITNARMPTEKAHGYQIAKMCEAFAALGTEVSLIAPARKNEITRSVFEYYGIDPIFGFRTLPLFDWLTLEKYMGKLSFYLLSLNFLMQARRLSPPKDTVIYTRTPEIAWLFSRRGYKTFFECHQMPNRKSWLFKASIKRVTGIITITHGLKNDILRRYAYPEQNILVAPDGVDLKTFDLQTNREEARQKLNLPQDKRIVLYTGHLFAWKGVDTLAQAAKLLPAEVLVYMVGGTDKEIALFRQRNPDASKVINVPARPRDEIALWLKAADILALPNSGKEAISEKYTSPLKLFEYMASGTPIVASELPSLQEIIDRSMAFYAKPDDPDSLAEAITEITSDKDGARWRADMAYGMVGRYTWHSRAKDITTYMKII